MGQKHAHITGGNTGIGLAIAKRLKKDGLRVTISGRNQQTLDASGFESVTLDLTDNDSISPQLQSLGPIDVFVNNAGAAITAPLLKTDDALWKQMLQVNLTAAFMCAKAVLPSMIEKRWGRFIVIASTSSFRAYPYTAAYAAAKHGVIGLVRSMALELAKTGVTANAICPGFTETELLQRSIDNIVEKTGRSEEQALASLVSGNPMKRAISPEEVADTAAWLASEGAASVNGQSIAIDGGELIS